jgi:Beta-lactamase enzyme family
MTAMMTGVARGGFPYAAPMIRRAALLLVLLALAAPATTAAADSAGWTPDVAAARAWAATRHGSIAFAVRTDQRLVGAGLDRPYPSASVVKAMLLVAYLRQSSVRHRALRHHDRALLAPMIRVSDNNAATAVRNIVGTGALVRLAHKVGMTRFRPDFVWGRSQITARDQTRFFLHIDSFMPARHRAYGMTLLRTISVPQRWGLARAIPDDWTLWFKGGWGAGTGAVDHQIGLLQQDGERIAVAVLTVGNPTHGYGEATEEGIARRLLGGLGGSLVGSAAPAGASLQP